MTPTVLPGMYFLRHISGQQGRYVAAMQAFVRGGSFWTHAGLILDNGELIQGEPGGAKIYPLGHLFDGQPLLVSDAPIQRSLHKGGWTVGDDLDRRAERVIREQVAAAGRELEGTPYSYLDYLTLGAVEFGWPGHERLRRYVESSTHLICSALVDRAYANAGIHLYDDGRFPGDVTPEDLDIYNAAWVAATYTRERAS